MPSDLPSYCGALPCECAMERSGKCSDLHPATFLRRSEAPRPSQWCSTTRAEEAEPKESSEEQGV